MKVVHDLSKLEWSLRGWHAWNWKLTLTRETEIELLPVAGPVAVHVPGSVQGALRDAGIIPDWNIATRSLAAEWVENRHWTFECSLPLALCKTRHPRTLVCDGLDHAGHILCGGPLPENSKARSCHIASIYQK